MKYTKEFLEPLVRSSRSFREVVIKCGQVADGAKNRFMKNRLIKLGIDFSHFDKKAKIKTSKGRYRYHWSEHLTHKKGERVVAKTLRKALLESGVEYKCNRCGNLGEWQGEQLTLQIDHINEDSQDNRKENLQFLCPNCHWLKTKKQYNNPKGVCVCGNPMTKTSSKCKRCSDKENGLKSRRVERPSKEELQLLLATMPMTKIGERFGVSDNAVRKWIKTNGLK